MCSTHKVEKVCLEVLDVTENGLQSSGLCVRGTNSLSTAELTRNKPVPPSPFDRSLPPHAPWSTWSSTACSSIFTVQASQYHRPLADHAFDSPLGTLQIDVLRVSDVQVEVTTHSLLSGEHRIER